jgi:hypothetical protein
MLPRMNQRERDDLEIARICMESAASDQAIAEEWESTLGDGLGSELDDSTTTASTEAEASTRKARSLPSALRLY